MKNFEEFKAGIAKCETADEVAKEINDMFGMACSEYRENCRNLDCVECRLSYLNSEVTKDDTDEKN